MTAEPPKRRGRRRRRQPGWPFWAALAVVVTAGLLVDQAAPRDHGAPHITVDFDVVTATLPPHPFSGTVSTYGDEGTLVTSAWHRAHLERLGLGLYRVPLQWNDGAPVSSARGAGPEPDGDAWVSAILALGAEPMIVIGGADHNNDFTPADAAGLVTHYPQVRYWVIGNEFDNDNELTLAAYCRLFVDSAERMRAVRPDLKLAGPALADFKPDDLADFLACAGDHVDIVDFHSYGHSSLSLAANIRHEAGRYQRLLPELRRIVERTVPHRADEIEIQVGEWNLSPVADGDLDPRFYSGGTTVFAALAAGSIAAGGGRSHQYADQNNPLGLTFQEAGIAAEFGRRVADPMPVYHGIGMFTGFGLFRGFGDRVVQARSDHPQVSVFAAANHTVVLVNTDETTDHPVRVELAGFGGGTAEVWQTDPERPFDHPTRVAVTPTGARSEYLLPAWSVTTLVLHPS